MEMDNKAVVYTSNTGTTKEYAEIIGRRCGLPVMSLEEALVNLERNDGIIYLGWILSGQIQGFERADKWFDISAVCAVGCGATGSQRVQIQEANKVECRLFTLQGGLFLDRLKGMNRLMMKIFSKSVIRGYKAQKNLTADEEALLELFRNGGSRVSEDNLTSFYEWYDMQ